MPPIFIRSQTLFIDTSAFKSIFDFYDEFHSRALEFLKEAEGEEKILVTSNFVLDETYTLIRANLGKAASVRFRQDVIASLESLDIVRVTLKDEAEAWKFFEKLPGRGVSYTDCTSFALMKRLRLSEAFTFDIDFRKAGFKVLP